MKRYVRSYGEFRIPMLEVVKVASNPRTRANTLRKIAEQETDCLVLHAVAKNKNATADTLELLSDNPNYIVRRAITENPNTSIETLRKMSEADRSTEIRMYAKTALYFKEKYPSN